MLVLSGHDGDIFHIEHAGETLRVVLVSTDNGRLGFDGCKSFAIERDKVRLAKMQEKSDQAGEAA